MGGSDGYFLELEVDEVDIVNIKVGQKALITLDAYPKQVFSGKVTFINGQKDDFSQAYKAEVKFEERPERWFAGMTAEANIIIEEKKDALLIPQGFLLGRNQAITSAGDTLTLEIGESDLEYVEVLKGLQVGTELIQPEL